MQRRLRGWLLRGPRVVVAGPKDASTPSIVYAWNVGPVANPSLQEAERQRLILMAKEQIRGRVGPVRQVRYRDQVVSPLALESKYRKLLQRAQCAIAAIVTSSVYMRDLQSTVEELVLRHHEWDIAVALHL
jgi:hypothetical protein